MSTETYEQWGWRVEVSPGKFAFCEYTVWHDGPYEVGCRTPDGQNWYGILVDHAEEDWIMWPLAKSDQPGKTPVSESILKPKFFFYKVNPGSEDFAQPREWKVISRNDYRIQKVLGAYGRMDAEFTIHTVPENEK